MKVELDDKGYPLVFTFPTEVGDVCQGSFTDGAGACCSIGWVNMSFYGTPYPKFSGPIYTAQVFETLDLLREELAKEVGIPHRWWGVQYLNDNVLTKAQVVKAWGSGSGTAGLRGEVCGA